MYLGTSFVVGNSNVLDALIKKKSENVTLEFSLLKGTLIDY